MFPEPEAVQVPPPAPTQVQVQVSEAGKVSATVEPGALLGPALVAVMVEVTVPPGVAVVTPSVSVIPRLACGARVSVSVALLFAAFGSPASVAVAVLLKVPAAEAAMAQAAV